MKAGSRCRVLFTHELGLNVTFSDGGLATRDRKSLTLTLWARSKAAQALWSSPSLGGLAFQINRQGTKHSSMIEEPLRDVASEILLFYYLEIAPWNASSFSLKSDKALVSRLYSQF